MPAELHAGRRIPRRWPAQEEEMTAPLAPEVVHFADPAGANT